MKLIDPSKFKQLITREQEHKDSLPEHTLDWYTAENKIALLKEVEDLFEDAPKAEPKKSRTSKGKDEDDVESK